MMRNRKECPTWPKAHHYAGSHGAFKPKLCPFQQSKLGKIAFMFKERLGSIVHQRTTALGKDIAT